MPDSNDTSPSTSPKPPSLLGRSLAFARRLTIFYLFAIATGLCFGIYYYKYLPSNAAELNGRAFRILNRLSASIVTRYDETVTAIDNTMYLSPACGGRHSAFRPLGSLKQGTLQQLHKNIRFDFDFDRALKKVKGLDSFYYRGNLLYWPDTNKAALQLELASFLQPILEKRCDLFDDYQLLYQPGGSRVLQPQIIFDQHALSLNGPLHIDSATGSRKNSDEATISDITISGKSYKLFLRPFELQHHQLLLAGLLEKNHYDKWIRVLPAAFLSNLVIFILLALICLPFVKIYLLSPKESISNKDTIALSLSIFVGSGIVFLILYYLCIGYAVQANFDKRLTQIGRSVSTDLQQELDQASRQLDRYNAVYDSLRQQGRTDILQALCYARMQQEPLADRLFTPTLFKGVDRVFWMSDTGRTLAKWNPFRFNTLLADVSSYPFFQRFSKGMGSDSLTVYPGWSNTTGEFQVLWPNPADIPY